MPPGELRSYYVHVPGRPKGGPWAFWRDYVSQPAWEHFRISLIELEGVSVKSGVWASLLGLLSP